MNIELILIYIALTFVVMSIINKLYINYAKKTGLLAEDVQKKGNPLVPKWGGITLILSFPLIFLYGFILEAWIEGALTYSVAFVLSSLIGYFVGVFDDLNIKRWDILKIVFISFAAVPIIIFKVYIPTLYIPFIGYTRLTIIYPLLLFIAYSVVANGMNMLDVVNGVMLFSQIVSVVSIAFWTYVLGYYLGFYFSLIYLAILLSYYIYNRYPARLFLGNVGSYGTATMFLTIVIFSKLEYIVMLILTPMILNSFSLLITMKTILTREEIKYKIGKLDYSKDGIMYPTEKVDLPINLTRMILLHGPLDEKNVIKIINALFVISTILANILAFIVYTL